MKINDTIIQLDTSIELKLHNGIYLKSQRNIFRIDTTIYVVYVLSICHEANSEQDDSYCIET